MRWAGVATLAALAVALLWTGMSARSSGKARRTLHRHHPDTDERAKDTRTRRLSRTLVAWMGSNRFVSEAHEQLEASGLHIGRSLLAKCWLAIIFLVPLATFFITDEVLVALSALAATSCLPRIGVKALARRHDRAEEGSRDAFVADLALFLRSGIPIEDALVLCARDSSQSIKSTVARFNGDVALGAGTEAALRALTSAMDSPDLELICQAVITSRETGSDIRSIMDTIGEAVRERAAIKRELASQTVQGRLSGKIVAALPLIFLALSAIASRSTIAILLGTVPGLIMLGSAAVMNIVGFLWIRKILDIR